MALAWIPVRANLISDFFRPYQRLKNLPGLQMIKGIEVSIGQLDLRLTENSDSKSTIRDTILVMRDLMPKMDDFYIKVLPVMEDLKKLQRQAVDQVSVLFSRSF